MAYRIIGICVLLAAGTIAYLVFQEGLRDSSTGCTSQQTPAEQLAQLIGDDFAKLKKEAQLPKAWDHISTIEYRMNSTLAKALLGKKAIGLKRVADGKYFLEMDFLDLPDEENPGIIVQASLFDIKSKNKIFEIGRTYTMAELNKTAPSSAPKEVFKDDPKKINKEK